MEKNKLKLVSATFQRGCHCDLWCAIKMKLEPVYFIQDICEIKNIMLLFYLCEIARNDVIWLLKPLRSISRLRLTIQTKASPCLWFVIRAALAIMAALHTGALGRGRGIWLTCSSFPFDSVLLISFNCLGVLESFFFFLFQCPQDQVQC